QYNLLKSFKKQITQPHSPAVVAAPVEKTVEQEALEELELFRKQMQGVQKIESGNTVQLDKPRKKKPDAQVLAKRAAATGPMETVAMALPDMRAMLNPVGSLANMRYRIASLQHEVLEDIKAGNLRWFEAVDLHGCTVEEARRAALQIAQIGKDEIRNVTTI